MDKMTNIGVAEAKARLSEVLHRAAYGHERFLVSKHGRPVAAIVSPEDLARLEESDREPAPRGLLAAVGALADWDAWEQIMDDVVRARSERGDRPVDIE